MKENEEVTFSNVSNGCPFSLLQGNARIRQTKSLGSLSNDDVDINEIDEKKQWVRMAKNTHFVHFFAVTARLRRKNV